MNLYLIRGIQKHARLINQRWDRFDAFLLIAIFDYFVNISNVHILY